MQLRSVDQARKQDEIISRPILDLVRTRPGAVFSCEMGTIMALVDWQPKPMAGLALSCLRFCQALVALHEAVHARLINAVSPIGPKGTKLTSAERDTTERVQ